MCFSLSFSANKAALQLHALLLFLSLLILAEHNAVENPLKICKQIIFLSVLLCSLNI